MLVNKEILCGVIHHQVSTSQRLILIFLYPRVGLIWRVYKQEKLAKVVNKAANFFLATSPIMSACSLVKADQLTHHTSLRFFVIFTSQRMILAVSFKSLTNLEESKKQRLLEYEITSLRS